MIRALFLPELYAIPAVEDRKALHSSIASKVRERVEEKSEELRTKRKARAELKAQNEISKKTKQPSEKATKSRTITSLSSGQSQVTVSSLPYVQLPPGWECRVTEQGQYYYVDNNTQTSSWYPPVMHQTPRT